MKIINIDKKNWDEGVQKARQSYKLIGPVRDGMFHLFKELDKNEMPDMLYKTSRLSPKEVVFPRSESILEYNLDENSDDYGIPKEIEKDNSPKAVIGIRPYDAKAIQLTKLNFDTEEHKDVYWLNAYESTTFVGLAVNEPSSVDFFFFFCICLFDEAGLDLLLIDNGENYFAKVITDKGAKFLDSAGFNKEVVNDEKEKAIEKINHLKEKAESSIKSEVSFDKIKDKTVLEIYDADFWDDLSFGCINCGTCTFCCPTCWCFDLQDEKVNSKKSVRNKNWDSCMFSLFTKHSSSHNPR